MKKKLTILGIAGDVPLEHLKAEDFTDDKYTGRLVMRHPSGMPAILMDSKKPVPYPWKIVYGSTSLHFQTRKEAMDYCHERFYTYINPRKLV